MSVSLNPCESRLEKQRTIDGLKQEIQSLREKVQRLERKAEAGPFGSSTPSAKIPLKAGTAEEQRSKPGGAKPGHTGHGRKAVEDSAAARIETIAVGPVCPHCSGALEHKEYRDRSVIESQPLRAEAILYPLERARCLGYGKTVAARRLRQDGCGKAVRARAPEVLPKNLYGNQLVTQVVFLHYRQGIPMGRLCDRLGIGLGAVFGILHRMAALFRGMPPKLIEDYHQAEVRHAGETGGRTYGRSGYAWLFASATVSLFLFRATRSAQVPKEVLGEQALADVPVVDRYAAYNRAPCALQYCYAHPMRDVEVKCARYSNRSWTWSSNPPNTWAFARRRASSATTPMVCTTGWKTVRCRPATTGRSGNCDRRRSRARRASGRSPMPARKRVRRS